MGVLHKRVSDILTRLWGSSIGTLELVYQTEADNPNPTQAVDVECGMIDDRDELFVHHVPLGRYTLQEVREFFTSDERFKYLFCGDENLRRRENKELHLILVPVKTGPSMVRHRELTVH